MEGTTASSTWAAGASECYRDRRFPLLFEAAAVGIALCHFDGRILEGNAALARLLGYEQEELAGLDPWKFHESDATSASNRLGELLRGTRDSFAAEKACYRKDGSQIPGRLTISLARDAQHDPSFLVVLVEDCTERNRLEQQLRQAERMEIIGRLTGGIAHDFNNLLTGFLLYCDLLLSKLDQDDPARCHVEEIRQAGEHGSALTQQLLAFARKQSPKPRATGLDQIVSSTENLLRRLIGEQIELVIAMDADAGQVYGDPGQLRQVLLNLALNARDALKPGGRVVVRTQARQMVHDAEGSPGSRRAVSLIVEDNGCGMSPETRAHLFEPFFTTKGPGEGTGMGLATVHRIVSEAGGEIEVASEPGRGTKIEVIFPELWPERSQENAWGGVESPSISLSARHSMGSVEVGSRIGQSCDPSSNTANGE